MLTQEELDRLLEESQNEEKPSPEDKGAEISASSSEDQSGTLNQEELDSLLEGASENKESDSLEEKKDESKAQDDISWEDAFKEAAQGGDEAAQKAVSEGLNTEEKQEKAVEASSAKFDEFKKEDKSPGNRPELDFLLEIPLEVQVELGRSTMKIKELLQLGQGSIVELNKMVGEPADIYVNRKLMAKGEVVVVNEKFGIKLTEIISPQERVKSLG